MAEHDSRDGAAIKAAPAQRAQDPSPTQQIRRVDMQTDPVDRVACRVGDSSCAAAHASVLNRSAEQSRAATQDSLLRLQRQYGNGYVGKVLYREAAQSIEIERSLEGTAGSARSLNQPAGRHTEVISGGDFGGVRLHSDSRADAPHLGRADAREYPAPDAAPDIHRSCAACETSDKANVNLEVSRKGASEVVAAVRGFVNKNQHRGATTQVAREGEGRTTLQCVNENLSSAGVAAWVLAAIGLTCGLVGALAGSPTGPGAAGTAALGAAVCIAGVTGFSVGFILGIVKGCSNDPNFRSRGAYLSEAATPSGGGEGGAEVA